MKWGTFLGWIAVILLLAHGVGWVHIQNPLIVSLADAVKMFVWGMVYMLLKLIGLLPAILTQLVEAAEAFILKIVPNLSSMGLS